jgi:tripartite-type tricarboxylate transporter receptor subunit TctC
MSGTIQSAFGSPGIFKTFQESGKIRVLAVSGSRRNPSLPDVPTFAESGYSDLDMMGWVGAFVSKGTREADIARLNQALRKALQSQQIRDRISMVGFGVDPTGTDEFKRQIGSEIQRWRTLGSDVKFD